MDRNKMKRKIAMMLCVCVLFASSAPLALAEAEATGADLIIVASHEPGMLSYVLGSNASAIVRRAKCSVLVVRH